MNCSTRAIGTTTAVALLAVRGTDDSATPSSAEPVMPRTNTHANTAHFAGSVGSSAPSATTAKSEQERRLQRRPSPSTWPILPMK